MESTRPNTLKPRYDFTTAGSSSVLGLTVSEG